MAKICWPCSQCVSEKTCDLDRGCYRWKKWFNAYWNELRRRWLC